MHTPKHTAADEKAKVVRDKFHEMLHELAVGVADGLQSEWDTRELLPMTDAELDCVSRAIAGAVYATANHCARLHKQGVDLVPLFELTKEAISKVKK